MQFIIERTMVLLLGVGMISISATSAIKIIAGETYHTAIIAMVSIQELNKHIRVLLELRVATYSK